ncbi:alpha-galactosidase [Christiangramia fulva]|uniref:Alpha-galactosidase n=1 Tax=Christiangramia fulva TaxID=2126553 RepID=A0A2R3ZAA3_9FLAO|nr:glycoside hydrolase family 27 protein [Christiangramia fulva]AVR47134.1 alpha-galactosidase [Christiangramia fulva]
MGWASWNHYGIHINEKIIKGQGNAIIETGMREAGYNYINIDDGYFGGRNQEGKLLINTKKFPSGMKALAKYLHDKGLKAGIYTDAGINTCASIWDNDTIGVGMGLYGHEVQDLTLMLKEWNYDFIKVDWCGGKNLGLDDRSRYMMLGKIIYAINPKVNYNICRWKFPGDWVIYPANSWRISGDIANNFESVMHIIDQNANLWPYSGPGHVNDMDMLKMGRGMTYEEDKTHFSMWCMLNSPLIAGNDLTKISRATLEILTNKELIALNQDPLVYQARRVIDNGDTEVWAKPLTSTMSGKVAVALLNRSNKEQIIKFSLEAVGLDSQTAVNIRDLWKHKDLETRVRKDLSAKVLPHGTVVLKIKGKALPYNIFQYDSAAFPQN